MPALFTYGSLTIPAVMTAVTGQQFDTVEADLPDFARFLLKNCTYPGIIPMPGCVTPGRLYFEVDAQSLQRLDFFENDCYERQTVTVACQTGERLQALAYVLHPAQRHLLTQTPWDAAQFRALHLTTFLAHIRTWMAGN